MCTEKIMFVLLCLVGIQLDCSGIEARLLDWAAPSLTERWYSHSLLWLTRSHRAAFVCFIDDRELVTVVMKGNFKSRTQPLWCACSTAFCTYTLLSGHSTFHIPHMRAATRHILHLLTVLKQICYRRNPQQFLLDARPGRYDVLIGRFVDERNKQYGNCINTGCFTTLGHNCRRWFPRSSWSKKFI